MNNQDDIEADDMGLICDGRYPAVCTEITDHVSGEKAKDPGSKGFKVTSKIGNSGVTDYLMYATSGGKKHPMKWKLSQFLRACGVKSDKPSFNINKEKFKTEYIGANYLVDVVNDGKWNKIQKYEVLSKEPESEPTMPGVPAEEPQTPEAPETEKEKVEEVVDVSEM